MTTVSLLRGLHLLCSASPLVSPPPPRRWLDSKPFRGLISVCAALYAAVLLSTLSTPAFAGHYDLQYTYDGTTTPGLRSVVDGHNITDWAEYGAAISTTALYSGTTLTGDASVSGTIKATFTWVRDYATDEPPTEVYISESSSAGWEGFIMANPDPSVVGGTGDNGLGGTYETYAFPDEFSFYIMGVANTSDKITKVNAGESFHCSCTLSATTTGGDIAGFAALNAGVSYSVHIIATPL